MNGKLIPLTPLAVDFWQVRKCSHVRLFFLSHMHGDHTVGLTSTWTRPIYCSPITATLLQLKLQVKQKWIHPLEVGGTHVLPLDDIGKETMTVSLIDANHCPGAVMFLFEGYFGTILYTGDFRYTPAMLREPCLRAQTHIDILYLDNTNCDPTRTLPSRQRATQQIKELIRAHPGHTVIIGLYRLGKESLLVDLALEFRTWVEVSPERLETLMALGLPDVFTTEPGAGRIRAVDRSEVHAANLATWNRAGPTLAILPTSRPPPSFHPAVHVVPYSDHSSYQELEDFVSALRPASLVPIVGAYAPCFSALLGARRKRRPVLVPESVRRYMAGPLEPRSGDVPMACGAWRHWVRGSAPRGVVFESPKRDGGALGADGWRDGVRSRRLLEDGSPDPANPEDEDGHELDDEGSEPTFRVYPPSLSEVRVSPGAGTELELGPVTSIPLKPRNLPMPPPTPSLRICPLKRRSELSLPEPDSTTGAKEAETDVGEVRYPTITLCHSEASFMTDMDSDPLVSQGLAKASSTTDVFRRPTTPCCLSDRWEAEERDLARDSEPPLPRSLPNDVTPPSKKSVLSYTAQGFDLLKGYPIAPRKPGQGGCDAFHRAMEKALARHRLKDPTLA